MTEYDGFLGSRFESLTCPGRSHRCAFRRSAFLRRSSTPMRVCDLTSARRFDSSRQQLRVIEWSCLKGDHSPIARSYIAAFETAAVCAAQRSCFYVIRSGGSNTSRRNRDLRVNTRGADPRFEKHGAFAHSFMPVANTVIRHSSPTIVVFGVTGSFNTVALNIGVALFRKLTCGSPHVPLEQGTFPLVQFRETARIWKECLLELNV